MVEFYGQSINSTMLQFESEVEMMILKRGDKKMCTRFYVVSSRSHRERERERKNERYHREPY